MAFRGAKKAFAPGWGDVELMTAIAQSFKHAAPDGGLQADAVEIEIMRGEETGKMFAAEFRRLDRFLQGHAEHQAAQQELQLPLILLVAAHAAERHPSFAVFHDQGWADGGSRALEGRDDIGMMRRLQIAIRQPHGERKTQTRYHFGRAYPAAAGSEGGGEAFRIHGVDMNRSGAPGGAAQTLIDRQQSCALERIAWANLGIGGAPDQFRTHRAVFIGEQGLHGNRHLLRIAVILLAVGKGQLDGLQHGMKIVRAVVPQRLQVEMFENGKRLQQRRSLIPRTAFVDIRAGITEMHTGFDGNVKALEIRSLQKAAFVLDKAHNLGGDVAAIEGIEHCAEARCPVAAASSFRLDQVQIHIR